MRDEAGYSRDLIGVIVALIASILTIWALRVWPDIAGYLSDEVGAALSVLESPAAELRALVRIAGDRIKERNGLRERAAELEEENTKLRIALHQAQADIRSAGVGEGESSRNEAQSSSSGQLPLTDRSFAFKFISARVTLRYPDAWWSELRVDRGARDGVAEGAPALADGFMVGRVVRVGEDQSWIELVTSSSFMLAAAVDDTWDLGVINGDDMGNIWLLYMPPEKKYERGMMISTALVGDRLPPGIPIGRVWGEAPPRDGSVPLKIASGAHLTQLYTVRILTEDS